MPFTTIFKGLLICYNQACCITLVIDQPFMGFLTNYFSALMNEDFEVRVLKLIPSALICEERYQKISFYKVIRDSLFKYRGTNKSFSFSSFFFLILPYSSLFFFFLFFLFFLFFFFRSFAFAFGEHGEFILEKLRLEVTHEN